MRIQSELRSYSRVAVVIAFILFAFVFQATDSWTKWKMNLTWVEMLRALPNEFPVEADYEARSVDESTNCPQTRTRLSNFPSYTSDAFNRHLGIFCLWRGQNEDAVLFFSRLEPVGSMREDVLLLYGYSFLELGKANKAISIWARRPNTLFHLVATGERWFEKGDAETALKYWSAAAELASRTRQPHSTLFLNLCEAELNRGNEDIALDWCSRAEASTDNPWLLLSIGDRFLQLRAFKRAESLARSILDSQSTEVVALATKRLLGRSLVAQKDYQQALAVYSELPDTDIYVLYEKGELLYQLDMRDDAYHAFQQVYVLAEKSSPQWNNAADWLQRLDALKD